jgi:hypothetical protein
MPRTLVISSGALAKASQLGIEIARTDPVIRPYLNRVASYENYARFRIGHRMYWEQSTRFERLWQERIYRIAEKEGRHHGFRDYNSVIHWDIWYNGVVHPLRSAMWEAWETQVQLESLYHEAVAQLAPRRTEEIHLMQALREGVGPAATAPIPGPVVAASAPAPSPPPPSRSGIFSFLFGNQQRSA